MKTVVFSTETYERPFFDEINPRFGHDLTFIHASLSLETLGLARGAACVCLFVNDKAGAEILEGLAEGGTRLLALRSAGFNHVDLEAAERLGIRVVRVPAYSPHAVAEHTVCLMLALNRKVHRAYNRVREGNFALHGLMGFDMFGKTAGIVGTGKIGACAARILHGFGCRLLGYDLSPNPECLALDMEYVSLDRLFAESDIVSLHCPLTPQTRHLINAETLARMKTGVQIVNTSRGAVVDTAAVIEGLKSGKIGSLGLDVYEEEGDVFFRNLSDTVLQDDQLARLLTFPNVLITGHQAFFTREALRAIVETTLANIQQVEQQGSCENEVHSQVFTR